jgi:hypothetical protein
MDARALPRRMFEWLFRPAALRDARRALPAADDRCAVAARQAKLVLEVARRTAEPAEALPPGGQQAVLLGLYRDAIYWALAAKRTDAGEPPADLRALWDASNPQLAAGSPPDNEASAALRKTLFDDYGPRALAVTDEDVGRARAFAEALVWDLDAPRRGIERVLVQRWLRVALAAAALVALVIGGRVLMLGPNLAQGKPFRTSSTWSGWTACVANAGCNGLMLHTETENNPWVEIDLGTPTKVHRIEVINRGDCCADRATPLAVEVSTDRAGWTQVARSDQDFGSWKTNFPARTARYVRLRVLKRSVLHLQAIAVR